MVTCQPNPPPPTPWICSFILDLNLSFSHHQPFLHTFWKQPRRKTATHALLLNPLKKKGSFTLIASHVNLYNFSHFVCDPDLSLTKLTPDVQHAGPEPKNWSSGGFPHVPQTALFTACSLIKTWLKPPPSLCALLPVFSSNILFLILYKLIQLTMHASLLDWEWMEDGGILVLNL